MSDSTIRDLFRSLEFTLHERLRTIEDVIRSSGSGGAAGAGVGAGAGASGSGIGDRAFEDRLTSMEARMTQEMNTRFYQLRQHIDHLQGQLSTLRATAAATHPISTAVTSLIPTHPLEGIEIVPKREVVIPDALSMENRLLLNKRARKALEAEEMGEKGIEEHPELDGSENEVVDSDVEEEEVEEVVEEEVEEVVEEEVEEVVEEVEEEEEEVEEEEEEVVEEEVVEEEVVEEEVVEEEEEGVEEEEEGIEEVEEDAEEEVVEEEVEEGVEEVQLEEFEYKGSTYYRDSDGNVFMTDEDGELMDEPIGVWNEVKQRIVVKKAAA